MIKIIKTVRKGGFNFVIKGIDKLGIMLYNNRVLKRTTKYRKELQIMEKRYSYLGNGTSWGFKIFKSYKEMVEWAKDDKHYGTYYIDCPNITFKKTRQQILNENANNK